MTTPTGTLAAGKEAAVFDSYAEQSEAAGESPFGDIGSASNSDDDDGDINARSLRPLTEGGGGTCGESTLAAGGRGSCNCPYGGTLTFDFPQYQTTDTTSEQSTDVYGKIDQTISLVATSCKIDPNQTVDGSIYYKIKNPPPMQIFSIHINLVGEETARYDVDYLYANGTVSFAVDVDDGRVIVSAKGNWDKRTKTGSLVIKDKSQTWTCEMNNGTGSCTSDKGETRQVGS